MDLLYNFDFCDPRFQISLTSGSHSVGIVRLQTEGHGVCLFDPRFSEILYAVNAFSGSRCSPIYKQTNSVALSLQATAT
jgi:hypothetical protein